VMFKYNYEPVSALPPPNGRIVRFFRDVGWVAVHKNMADTENHVQLMVKSGPYGSNSHSHADQNNFTLFAYGQPLTINSGFYSGGYGGNMHNYNRTTRAHNTLLFDGAGQASDLSDEFDPDCRNVIGKIVSVDEESNFVKITADASLAYRANVPYLDKFIREIYFIDDSYAVIVDRVSLSREANVNFMLHACTSFNIEGSRFFINGTRAGLYGEFAHVSAGVESVEESDVYHGLDEKTAAGYEKQFHLMMTAQKNKNHIIATLLCPVRKGEARFAEYVKYDETIRFTNGGSVFEIDIRRNNLFYQC